MFEFFNMPLFVFGLSLNVLLHRRRGLCFGFVALSCFIISFSECIFEVN